VAVWNCRPRCRDQLELDALIKYSLDKGYRLVTVVPNGPTTAALDLALLGTGFEIICSRRLVRGLFPLNPFAAEFGSNYDVVVTINASSDEVRSKVMGLLQSKYPCTVIA
jgi:hypothetical protein